MRDFFRALTLLCVATPLAAQVPVFPVDTVRVEVGSRASSTLPYWTRGVEVITSAEIRRLPVRTIPEVLEWAMGVDVMPRSPAQADVGIRGSTYEQVLVLVDGVRMSDPQTGHFDLNLAVPLAQVERIEVLRGPASALYGSDAVGGVIHIVTRRGGAPSTTVSAQTGTFATRVLSGAVRLGNPVGWLDFGVDEHRSDGHRSGTDFLVRQWRLAVGSMAGGRPLRADVAVAERDIGSARFYPN
jgi:vitamin B12 transporter